MVSGEQTRNLKIEHLPEVLIIVAYTSQIVKNISEGLRGIQRQIRKIKTVPGYDHSHQGFDNNDERQRPG